MAESDIGPWLDPQTPSANRLDLLEAARARAVVYFNLQADSRPLLAQMLGAAIVGDLQAVVAGLQGRPEPAIVAIDEFSAIAPERVVGLFARAGGAGVSLVLGTQELADMRLPGREMLLEQVVGNLSVLIAHRQVVPGSAELIAADDGNDEEFGGPRETTIARSPARAHLDHALQAGQVMSLSQGCAAVIGLSDGGRVSVARMLSVASAALRRGRHLVVAPTRGRWSGSGPPPQILELRRTSMVRRDPASRPSEWRSSDGRRAIGAVTAEALAIAENVPASSARARLQAAERAGLLARSRPLAKRPALYTATRTGMRRCGLRGLDPCRVERRGRPALDRVRVRRRRVAARLSRSPSVGERELRRDERELGVAIASAHMGFGLARSAAAAPPRPGDLAARVDGRPIAEVPESTTGLPVAVEIELTIKAPTAPDGHLPCVGSLSRDRRSVVRRAAERRRVRWARAIARAQARGTDRGGRARGAALFDPSDAFGPELRARLPREYRPKRCVTSSLGVETSTMET